MRQQRCAAMRQHRPARRSAPRPVLVFWALAFVVALFFAGRTPATTSTRPTFRSRARKSARAAKLTERQFGGTISDGDPAERPARGSRASEGPRARPAAGADRRRPGPEPVGDRRRTGPARAPGRGAADASGHEALRADLRRDHARRWRKCSSDYVKPPLKAELTGLAPLVRAINEASLDSLDQGELIALPSCS